MAETERLADNERLVIAISEIVQALVEAYDAGKNLNVTKIKGAASRRHNLVSQPKLVDIIAAIPDNYRTKLWPLLKAKGVAIVAVMCKPHRCPHISRTGNPCLYCPGGPDSDFEYSTQSYTGYEPTSMRAIRARYDPFLQARNRIDQLVRLGHSVDKVEYIIMGGTFMSLAKDYRDWFAASLHDALSGHHSAHVDEAVRYSEQSNKKCVGLTIETRPDYCSRANMMAMLRYGCTRLEIGVQCVYEDVARDTNRGHTVQSIIESFSVAKDAGFKVVAHMMPGLPNVGMERDVAGFKELVENPAFRPDGMKIYPTLVMRGTTLHELWSAGRYVSYTSEELGHLLARVLGIVPPWMRVYRIQRDIPMPLASAGFDSGNLRETSLAQLRRSGLPCRDIRSREVGIQFIHFKVRPQQVELMRRDYAASDGWETFLSYEDARQDILIGMLRLRAGGLPGESYGDDRVSIVRELHVYGSAVPVHGRDFGKFQHQGYGTLLMEEAERIAFEEHCSDRIMVISGVGTRHYYRKLGYELEGPYMVKRFTQDW